MSFLKFLYSKMFLINMLIAIAFVFVVIWGALFFLDRYTLHNQRIEVPDLGGLTIDQVDILLKAKQLRYYVIDSSFVEGKPPLVVLAQNPKPVFKVKENRTIYLTVNASMPPMISMPKLTDRSVRSAIDLIETKGLRSGKLIYRPYAFENYVIEQLYKGEPVDSGVSIVKGSYIDLVVGSGVGSSKVAVPNVIELTLSEAEFILKASSLNLGAVVYDNTVVEKDSAIIYQQFPENPKKLRLGQLVDVYLK